MAQLVEGYGYTPLPPDQYMIEVDKLQSKLEAHPGEPVCVIDRAIIFHGGVLPDSLLQRRAFGLISREEPVLRCNRDDFFIHTILIAEVHKTPPYVGFQEWMGGSYPINIKPSKLDRPLTGSNYTYYGLALEIVVGLEEVEEMIRRENNLGETFEDYIALTRAKQAWERQDVTF